MRRWIGLSFIGLVLLAFAATAVSAWTQRQPLRERIKRMGRQRQFFRYYHESGGEAVAQASKQSQVAVEDHLQSARRLLSRLALLRGQRRGAKPMPSESRKAILAEVIERQRRLRDSKLVRRLPGSILKALEDRQLRDDTLLIDRLESLIVVEEALATLAKTPSLTLDNLELGSRSERSSVGLVAVAAAKDIGLRLRVRGPRAAVDRWIRALAANVDEDGDDDAGRVPFFLSSLKLGFLPGGETTVAHLSIFAMSVELRKAEEIKFGPARTEAESQGEEE